MISLKRQIKKNVPQISFTDENYTFFIASNIDSYDAITMGSHWKFLRLVKKQVDIEAGEHFIANLYELFRILSKLLKQPIYKFRSLYC